jgi:alpha-mannosidase
VGHAIVRYAGFGAHLIRKVTEQIIQGGHFSSNNLSPLLYKHRLDDSKHVSLEVWSAPGRSKPTFAEAKRQTYKAAKKGDSFGPSWTNHWFKVTLHFDQAWEGEERIQFEFDCSGEAMIFDTDGNPYHGERDSSTDEVCLILL